MATMTASKHRPRAARSCSFSHGSRRRASLDQPSHGVCLMSSGRRPVVLYVHGSPSCYSSPHQCHPPGSPHAPNRLPHLRAPARVNRQAQAHEPRLPTPAQDVARRMLRGDVTQIDYYTERGLACLCSSSYKCHLRLTQPDAPKLTGGSSSRPSAAGAVAAGAAAMR